MSDTLPNSAADSSREARADRNPAEVRIEMLQRMLLGVIESTALAYRAHMPDPLPSVAALAVVTPRQPQYFALPGMYGGFNLSYHDEDPFSPYVLAESWCRVAGGSQLLRRITSRSVEIVSQGLY